MGFLDSIRDRLRGGDDYYDDDDYYDEDPDGRGRGADDVPPVGSRAKLLGNTSRPEAESVSVYTRSGRPVSSQRPAADYDEPRPSRSSYAQPEPSSPYAANYEPAVPSTGNTTPGDVGLRPKPRVTSGQLPPYVLRPVSYDDVQSVVRRVRTNQPVVLVFKNTNIETAKRILDFSFGLSYGVDGAVEELGDRVFAVLPQGISLTQADIDKLVSDGDLAR